MAQKAVEKGLLLRPNAMQTSGPHATLKLNPVGRIHRSFQGALWTSVAGWPRWFNPLLDSPDDDGDRAREQGYLHNSVFARHDICRQTGSTELPFRTLKPGESVSVDVRSDELWNNTGLILEAGGSYHFEARGYWQDLDDTPFNPQGQPARQESKLKKLVRWARRAPKLPWMHLVGMINYPRPWPWIERPWYEALYFLFIADPKQLVADLFSIGLGTTVRVEKDGVLWTFANDMWKFYANNTGSITLTVERSLGPPDSNPSSDATPV
ncbi:hypothetical protein HNV11_04800 [Spirosoma taeanense]|uniref:Uncharacterized protein n=1 Tax=Spirosoma taeanense TaxID=2735870 RepID=A0A6M5Y5R1_9BACT|nr:hypothetical protein [Spirosoma taeanense]QJW88746.1 hypothetical protein HNV11_04800 [Spirosoma taeanense]